MTLLETLVKDLTPVRPRRPAWQLVLVWSIFPILSALFVLWFRHVRSDVSLKMTDMMFMTENTLMLAASIMAAYTALWLSVPSLHVPRLAKATGVAAVGCWAVLLVYAGVHISASELTHHLQQELMDPHGCISCIMLLALLPSAVLFYMCRRAAPLRPLTTGFFILLANGSFLALVTRYTCALDYFPHLFFAHFMPVMVLGVLGLVAGRFLLKF